MDTGNWLTLLASLITLSSVVLAFWNNKRQHEISQAQIANTQALAVKQIEAASAENLRKLRAEIIVKERQSWLNEFRETMVDILHQGDPYLDEHPKYERSERVDRITRLAFKVDLMLPTSQNRGRLASKISELTEFTFTDKDTSQLKSRLETSNEIITITREILQVEAESVTASLLKP